MDVSGDSTNPSAVICGMCNFTFDNRRLTIQNFFAKYLLHHAKCLGEGEDLCEYNERIGADK
jgi:hypothetical protein